MILEEVVRVGHVSVVMLAVVNLHRLGIDVRLKCGGSVGEGGKGEGHEVNLFQVGNGREESTDAPLRGGVNFPVCPDHGAGVRPESNLF